MIMRIPALHMLVRKAADWDEAKHPRADNGQFGSGSGGSSKPKKPSKTRRKMERREEAASQARVGGAIQSLLSGGSALDKIGWLNTSQKEPEKPAAKPKEEAAPAKEPSRQEAPQQPEKPKPAMSGAGQQADISDIFPRGVAGGIPTKGKVDFTKPYTLVVSGNTYGYKDDLKSEGFVFNSKNKTWDKTFTPPSEPSPYGGTLEENQRNGLNSAIASAGKGKHAHRNLAGELVQATGPTQPATTQSPASPDASFTESERGRFETFKQTKPGNAMGQNTTFAVAGRNMTHDRKATIMLSNRTDKGEGYHLILRLNNPYAEHMGSEDTYRIKYAPEQLGQAIKDYTHVIDNKDHPSENFKVFERAGHKWPGVRRRMGIPVPGDELATLEIPGKPKQPEKPKPKVSLADQATKLKLKDLKELPLGKLRSMQAALQKHPKFNNPAYSDGKKYDKALQMVEGAIYSKA